MAELKVTVVAASYGCEPACVSAPPVGSDLTSEVREKMPNPGGVEVTGTVTLPVADVGAPAPEALAEMVIGGEPAKPAGTFATTLTRDELEDGLPSPSLWSSGVEPPVPGASGRVQVRVLVPTPVQLFPVEAPRIEVMVMPPGREPVTVRVPLWALASPTLNVVI